MKKIRVSSPAKINLYLRVLGKRSDGYHDIETIFQEISLRDELVIQEIAGDSRIEVPGHRDLESENNLALKALRWLEKRTQSRFNLKVTLLKRIPVGAGLGGGSSNGAGVLKGINVFLDLGLSDTELLCGAKELGADVAFFLMGGTAVGEEIGQRLTPISLWSDYAIVLVNPGFEVSTQKVFQAVSETLTVGMAKGTVWDVLQRTHNVENLLVNDLQKATEKLYPEVSEIKRALVKSGIENVLMSGSGPTVFGVTDFEQAEKSLWNLPDKWIKLKVLPSFDGLTID